MFRSNQQLVIAALLAIGSGLMLGRTGVAHFQGSPSNDAGIEQDVATVALTGLLDAAARMSIFSLRGSPNMVLAVALKAEDWLSCEDLGRQLRSLQREADVRQLPLVVWTTAESLLATKVFLRREGLGRLAVIPLEELAIVENRGPIATPAALLFSRDGTILTGVSHPVRSLNLRAVSFVEELEWSSIPE